MKEENKIGDLTVSESSNTSEPTGSAIRATKANDRSLQATNQNTTSTSHSRHDRTKFTNSEHQPKGSFHLPKEDQRGVIVVSDGQRESSNSNLKKSDPQENAELEQLDREFTLKFCTRYYRGSREFSDAKMARYIYLVRRICRGLEE